MSEASWRIVWVQTLNGAREELLHGLAHPEAVKKSREMMAQGLAGFGGVFVVEQEDEPHPAGNAPALGTLA